MNVSTLGVGGPGLGASERALELAYKYLSRRERTVSEVRQHLRGHDIDERVAAAAIRELTEQGYLDDARFARMFVEDKRALEQWGSQRIRRGLLARGIDRELAEDALRLGPGSEEQCSELDRALRVLRQRFAIPPQGRRERERALGLLLRKGYGPDLALQALQVHGQDQPPEAA